MNEYLEADLRLARRDMEEAKRRRDDQIQVVAGLSDDAAALAFAERVLIEREHTLYLTQMCLMVVEHLDDGKADALSRPMASTMDSRTTSTASR